MDLHGEIINIRQEKLGVGHSQYDYNLGHRDARHAAAELSIKYTSLIERLFSELENRHADDVVAELKKEFNL